MQAGTRWVVSLDGNGSGEAQQAVETLRQKGAQVTESANENIVEAKRTSEPLDILIQDPLNECSYLVPAEALKNHEVSEEIWTELTPNTVTFVIPDGDIVETAPPANRSPEGRPDVLIQHPGADGAYFLTYEDLLDHRLDINPGEALQYGISFSIPYGYELIEELSPLRRSLLQSGEVGVRRYVD